MDPKSESRADHRAAQICVALHQTGFAGDRGASLKHFTPRYLTSDEHARLAEARQSAGWAALSAHAKQLRKQGAD